MDTHVTLSALDWFVFGLLLPPTHYQRQLASFQARSPTETRDVVANPESLCATASPSATRPQRIPVLLWPGLKERKQNLAVIQASC